MSVLSPRGTVLNFLNASLQIFVKCFLSIESNYKKLS